MIPIVKVSVAIQHTDGLAEACSNAKQSATDMCAGGSRRY